MRVRLGPIFNKPDEPGQIYEYAHDCSYVGRTCVRVHSHDIWDAGVLLPAIKAPMRVRRGCHLTDGLSVLGMRGVASMWNRDMRLRLSAGWWNP